MRKKQSSRSCLRRYDRTFSSTFPFSPPRVQPSYDDTINTRGTMTRITIVPRRAGKITVFTRGNLLLRASSAINFDCCTRNANFAPSSTGNPSDEVTAISSRVSIENYFVAAGPSCRFMHLYFSRISRLPIFSQKNFCFSQKSFLVGSKRVEFKFEVTSFHQKNFATIKL